jgi:hypothetical protein
VSSSFQKEKLDAECEVADPECEIDGISACREGAGGEAGFHVHWSGGIDKWKGDATTWQALESDKVLAVWEKQGERESIMLEGSSAINRDARLAALPQPGSGGVVGCWIDAVIRGHKSKAKNVGFQDSRFKIEFEQFKAGEHDPDDGVYDLLKAQIRWNFTDPPPRQLAVSSAVSTRGRVATRNRH